MRRSLFTVPCVRRFVILTAIAALLCGLVSTSFSADAKTNDVCVSNLTNVWRLLHEWVGDGDTFPPRLASLAGSTTNLDLFLCPRAAHQAPSSASMTNVDAWTDYIYVANQRDVPPMEMPLLISPPENHGGFSGCVAWKSGKVGRLPAPQIRMLVATPWCMATNASELQLEMIKNEIVVVIPERLLQFYPDAYHAKGSLENKR